ncbi:ATP-grasp domain-containing protein [Aquibium microcysteis]|uniref:ATP-grasp domain-containing protein n=1 Tax=Aquibium microcysteis TaxID=675281 RepID=UPI0023B31766|nr:ATP-grasp domain-containing protein [Aquibium microcysteis]
MDSVIYKLSESRSAFSCTVVTPEHSAVSICNSKLETYRILQNSVKTPKIYARSEDVDKFPVYLKPDVGYGGRRHRLCSDREAVESYIRENPDCIILEYLPGQEYTIDCFTRSDGRLLLVEPRERNRIVNGISASSEAFAGERFEFEEIANSINSLLRMRGAWFFQAKRDYQGRLTLMEVACRIAGSSGVNRLSGINLPLLTLFDFSDTLVRLPNGNKTEYRAHRALEYKAIVDVNYASVYVDLDDCLIIENSLNITLVTFLFQAAASGKRIVLITRSSRPVRPVLSNYRISELFDEIIHLVNGEKKSRYISRDSIFVDDSFEEREEVLMALNIPVYAPDALSFFTR